VFYCRPYRGAALRLELLIFGEEQTSSKHEVAGIPQIAFFEVTFGRFVIRLFDKLVDPEDILSDRRTGTNVAIFGRRPRRLDAERDDTIRAGGVGRERSSFHEGCRIGDDVVGGERNNDWIVGALGCICCAGRNSGSGIAPRRLEQDIGFGSDFRELLGDQKTILRVGYDDRASEQRRTQNAVHRVLKRRMRTE
jgi:hypothetical protein